MPEERCQAAEERGNGEPGPPHRTSVMSEEAGGVPSCQPQTVDQKAGVGVVAAAEGGCAAPANSAGQQNRLSSDQSRVHRWR